MKKIFLLEDDLILQNMIKHTLSYDFDITYCVRLDQAKTCLKQEQFDLFILDRKLPDGDGIEICKLIRENENLNEQPIIFLSGLDAESEKILGFYSGADDYITKPFSLLELKARIQARLKKLTQKILTNELEVNLDSRIVKYKPHISEESINLTPTEFKLLVFFLQNKDKVFNRDYLINKIWGDAIEVSDRVVDTHISHIRQKLSKSSIKIKSYRSEGYKLVSGI